jgi:NAD(P)-dependent dehydrogenase (short-subunit alcohol dehydrogenase family)
VDVPGQAGRTAVVTGANSGIGFETARVLAEHGATVILACRDVAKGAAAAARISGPGQVLVQQLDLGSLASVRAAAEEMHTSHQQLDLLINNAGVMMPPPSRTADGFELQFGVNHLGHFALTGLLLDLLLPAAGSRVVTVSSNMHRAGRMNFADLQSARHYRRVAAYGQSKLANLLFTYELQRRLAAAGAQTSALAAHPGTAITALTRYFPPAVDRAYHAMGQPIAQQPQAGALPTLRAATDPAARGGEYYGPDGWLEFKGYPHRVSSSARSHDAQAQRRLWQESERLTGVRYAGV